MPRRRRWRKFGQKPRFLPKAALGRQEPGIQRSKQPQDARIQRYQRATSTGARHYFPEHRLGEHPSRGVLTAAMIRVDEVSRLVELVLVPVAEGKLAALEPARHEEGIVPHPPERQHDPDALEGSELGLQVRIAAADFIGSGLFPGGTHFTELMTASASTPVIVRRDRFRTGGESRP